MVFINVPESVFRWTIKSRIFHIKSVIFLLTLNICLKFSAIVALPTSQQEQELLLLEALSKRQPSYYGTSNSLMDLLGRSMFSFPLSLFLSRFVPFAFDSNRTTILCMQKQSFFLLLLKTKDETKRKWNRFEPTREKFTQFSACISLVSNSFCFWSCHGSLRMCIKLRKFNRIKCAKQAKLQDNIKMRADFRLYNSITIACWRRKEW